MKAMSPARETTALAPVAPTAPPQAAAIATTNVTPPAIAGQEAASPAITVPAPEKVTAADQTTTVAVDKNDRRAQLRAKIAEDAFNNLARLRELLKTAPESVRPALMQAISVAEDGYAKALEALN